MNEADSTLAREYVSHVEVTVRDGTDAEFFEARERLDDLVRNDPDRAWPIVIDVIQRTSHDDLLGYVCAGPLEDLLVYHGHILIDRVEALGKQDPHFRRALRGVWGRNSMPPDVGRRLDELVRDVPSW